MEPVLNGKALSNVETEHVYKIRATFAASSELTYRSKGATIAKTTTTTFTVTLPKPYAEITDFSYAWFAATGVAPLAVKVITNNLATAGTLVLETEAANTAGTPTAPATGDVLYLTLGVSCDTLNDRFTG
jgi:hypothetical protein